MKTASVLASLAVLAVALVPQAGARKEAAKRNDPATGIQLARLMTQINHHRDETWKWQRVMQRPLTRYAASAEKVRSVPYRQWVMHLWIQRALDAKQLALNPPHKAEWLCIHHYEGSWTDPNPPYWGGLQMDMAFMRAYGPEYLRAWGTADHWPPAVQIAVAMRAYLSGRGFWPWPTTARMCGLL